MSTQTIAGVVGASIGFVATGGNPAGAQWGFMIGSMVGGAMTDGPQSFGPRLADLAVQTATEGQPMPIDWGTVRHAGVVLWSTDLRERATESDVGGKGGPSATQTTYSYDVDLGVLITDGQIQGVRRIWANNRLIYDGRETADASAVMASSKLAAQITIYLGTEDQLPDPTYEAAFGVGNCPAYRGKSIVVFKELQLAKFGNAIPSFSFEFVKSGSVNPYRRLTLASIPQQFKTSGVSGLGSVTVFSAGDVVRAGVAGGLGGSRTSMTSPATTSAPSPATATKPSGRRSMAATRISTGQSGGSGMATPFTTAITMGAPLVPRKPSSRAARMGFIRTHQADCRPGAFSSPAARRPMAATSCP